MEHRIRRAFPAVDEDFPTQCYRNETFRCCEQSDDVFIGINLPTYPRFFSGEGYPRDLPTSGSEQSIAGQDEIPSSIDVLQIPFFIFGIAFIGNKFKLGVALLLSSNNEVIGQDRFIRLERGFLSCFQFKAADSAPTGMDVKLVLVSQYQGASRSLTSLIQIVVI